MRTATIVVEVLALCLAAGCDQRSAKTITKASSTRDEAAPLERAAGQDRHATSTTTEVALTRDETVPTERAPGPGPRATSNIAEVALVGDEAALIERAERLGRAIYMHDKYAATATDVVEAHGVDLVKIGARGWITEARPDGYTVTFVAGGLPPWRSVCVVTFTGNEEPNAILTDGDLTETQSAMFRARQFAIESIERPRPGPYNTVVIPRDDAPGWLAYALAATTDPNIIVVGGHYRATVAPDGLTLLEHRGFTKSHLDLPRRPKDIPPDAELAGYTVSHLLDNTPTEIHVFLNLQCGKTFFVATPDERFWRIEKGKIRLVERPW
jgi:hypothetical protein